MHGTVRRIFAAKGYCFIKGEDNLEYFAHRGEFKTPQLSFDDVRENMSVSYDIDGTSPKGPRAINVVKRGS